MRWNLDVTHAEVGFSVKHLMISTTRGRFKTFTGSGETNLDGTLRSVEMAIEAASIDTNVAQRDDHLRSADFFDVAKYPAITFRSAKVTQEGSDVTIVGDLTMRGSTRPVTLAGEYTAPTSDPWGNPRAALVASAKINRKDWGLVWNQILETGGVAVSEDVRLHIEVEAVAAQETVTAAA